jgi:hypothetical protein
MKSMNMRSNYLEQHCYLGYQASLSDRSSYIVVVSKEELIKTYNQELRPIEQKGEHLSLYFLSPFH